ncbi:ankyrin repeat domain-containing protein [Tahibacter harae]|uniref:Ankyrin repeat domain-containing protein n=1 Tax=Tahibacter harae TaxID=2963937 RepID=A0ABT1QRM0_9GAMM|nr:ankyrin repeat domain-containing protein [Tahibacter harae]MCQ4164939.1 ankyrin repeat domain-containing protein [Tahibacter harae]
MRCYAYLAAAVLLGCAGFASAQPADARMTRAQAEALMEEDGTDVMQENLPVNLFNAKADIVEAMLVLGVDPNGKLEQTPQSTMEFAVSACMDKRIAEADVLKTLDLLFRYGARADDSGMMPPLILAAQQCTPAVVKRLIAGGAKLDVRLPQGFTPLSMALIVGKYDNAEVLIDAGARLSAEGAAKLSEGQQDNAKLMSLVKRATAK